MAEATPVTIDQSEFRYWVTTGWAMGASIPPNSYTVENVDLTTIVELYSSPHVVSISLAGSLAGQAVTADAHQLEALLSSKVEQYPASIDANDTAVTFWNTLRCSN